MCHQIDDTLSAVLLIALIGRVVMDTSPARVSAYVRSAMVIRMVTITPLRWGV